MERESIVFYKSFYEAIKELDEKDRLSAFEAIIEYGLYGEEPEESGIVKAIFALVRPQIDANNKRYKNGLKGGRGNQDATELESSINQDETKPEPKPNQDETKPKPNVNVNDNVNDNENDNENVNVKKKAPAAHAHGAYGWVKLTDEQYGRLCADLGESEVKRCIDYIDELAQSTSNKNKWRDWNLVVRRCSREKWGLKTDRPKAGNVFDEWRNA